VICNLALSVLCVHPHPLHTIACIVLHASFESTTDLYFIFYILYFIFYILYFIFYFLFFMFYIVNLINCEDTETTSFGHPFLNKFLENSTTKTANNKRALK
jgi:hypothetical protein